MTWRWYLTIAAVRQYMELAGLTGELEDDNPDFLRAQRGARRAVPDGPPRGGQGRCERRRDLSRQGDDPRQAAAHRGHRHADPEDRRQAPAVVAGSAEMRMTMFASDLYVECPTPGCREREYRINGVSQICPVCGQKLVKSSNQNGPFWAENQAWTNAYLQQIQ